MTRDDVHDAELLRVRDLTVRFGDTTAVDGVDLGLPAGRVLAVLGPSGCGKSTLLRAVAGLEPVSAGSIALEGRDQAGVPTHRRGVALMFQDGVLFPQQSVAGNVAYPLRLARVPRAERAARVAHLLDLVGLGDLADRRPATLSGGEQQRVALARCLAREPRLLLLDEPLSALDRSLRERLAGDLRRILRETGITAVLVTHDHDEAFGVADEVAIMRAGRLVQRGDAAQVWRAPVDEEVARFLGYTSVVDGAWAARLCPGADRVALRPTALRPAPEGELAATVVAVTPVRDGLRLDVDLRETLDADASGPRVQALALRDHPAREGEPVTLRLDVAETATWP